MDILAAVEAATQHAQRRGRTQRRTRWGPASQKLTIAGLPALLPTLLTDAQLAQYLRVLRIEEISTQLRANDVIPPDDERSPSPEAEYGTDGRRINTRDVRYRKRLEDERHRLVDDASNADPFYRPPIDYKRPTRQQDKVYIPADEFPEVNFIGLLIGPRGRTLQKIESECGVKISIRGKGAHKEGRGFKNPQYAGEDEELHALVMGPTEEKIAAGVRMINQIIEEACSTPEQSNALKQQQMRELAILNGTLRDDNLMCKNCGEMGHVHFECPHRANVTSTLRCKICNAQGHVASDCKDRSNPEALKAAQERSRLAETEYESFLQSIQHGSSTGGQRDGTANEDGEVGLGGTSTAAGQQDDLNAAPWAKGTLGNANPFSQPAPWAAASTEADQPPPPWMQQQPPPQNGTDPNAAWAMAQPPVPGMGYDPNMPWAQQQAYPWDPSQPWDPNQQQQAQPWDPNQQQAQPWDPNHQQQAQQWYAAQQQQQPGQSQQDSNAPWTHHQHGQP